MTSVTADPRSRDARLPGRVADAALALALAGTGLLLTWSVAGAVDDPPGAAEILVAAAFLYAPLVWWRRRPVVALLAVTVGFALQGHFAVPEWLFSSVALFVALVGAGAYGHDRWRTPVRALTVAVLVGQLLVMLALPGVFESRAFAAPDGATVLWGFSVAAMNVLFFVAAWLLGNALRTRRLREQELAVQASELQAEREENARRAVVEERIRIARELHDVVAHHLSIIGLQAGAARRVLGRNPDRAREALAVVETSSAEAVEELQRLVVLLRAEESADGRGPRPSLERLRDLVAQVSDTLQVELRVEGDVREVPPSVGVSAFRVAQEALTNTLRHAHATRAEVTVRYLDEAVEVEVSDDGRGTDARDGDLSGQGHGIAGMRERLALHGGVLETANRRGGGFRVLARFPARAPDVEPLPASGSPR